MTTNEIIAMAREADPFGEDGRLFAMASVAPGTLERFAALATEAEREACAQVCDHYAHAKDYGGNTYMRSQDCKNAAKTIRARGKP